VILLEAKGIRKRFGGVIALSNGNLTCRKGKITGLLGANGSGKSTISKIITGVYSADAGEIKYKGKRVNYKNPNEAKKDGIAMVFQNLSLVADLSVWQNIVLGAEEKRRFFLNDKGAREASKEIVDQLLPGLDIDKKVYQLHPGEMQIVEVAKAIYQKPELLILDEPTAALEHKEVKSLFNYMRKLAQEGVAMIFTSHRISEVMEICDDIIVFRNGENVGAFDFTKEERNAGKIISCITGDTVHKGENNVKGPRKPFDEIVLRIKDMNYGKVLKNVSFELKKGEILGIGGLAGQGQYELMLALAGNYSGISCTAELKGKRIKLDKPANAIENSIFLVPGDRQQEGLFLRHSVYTNLIFPQLGMKKQPLFIPTPKYKKKSQEIINRLSIITHSLDTPVSTLSGGNQQKVVVGKWLPFDANVLLLCDPAKGVDVGAKKDLYEHILKQVREKETSIILYASDSEELIQYCDRVLIMYEGKVVAVLEGDDIKEDKIIAASMRVS
jgi:ribose transport system ATP-binding protein